MRKLDKIISIVTIILMLICISTNVFAANTTNTTNTTKAKFNISQITSTQNLDDNTVGKMETVGNTILTVITNVAMILAIVVIAVLGVKYMLGSTEEKGEYKKSMMPYLVGAILVFGASAIGKMVVGLGQGLE